MLPNIVAPLIVIASFNVAGRDPVGGGAVLPRARRATDVPTWGGMLAESRDQLLAGRWWLAIFPGVAIMLTVLSFNILGDWLRDFLDPRLKAPTDRHKRPRFEARPVNDFICSPFVYFMDARTNTSAGAGATSSRTMSVRCAS